ncbi:uncharacterized protein [Primulina eburnea]|uniref:uncharacterized protein n=1 Tax=Primulina eburnea TaxID=1245227 RepID=UPI003C6CA96A
MSFVGNRLRIAVAFKYCEYDIGMNFGASSCVDRHLVALEVLGNILVSKCHVFSLSALYGLHRVLGHSRCSGHRGKALTISSVREVQADEPKEFLGTTDPMIAKVLIKSIEVIFAFMELQDADMVRCATFILIGDARLWWKSASITVNLQTLPWDDFNEVFYSKYFNEEVRSRPTREFMTLQQGDNSFSEFVRKFERGCHFVPLISNDAQGKLRNFMDGLRPILCRDVRVAVPTTYVVVVSRAFAAEQDQRDIEVDM